MSVTTQAKSVLLDAKAILTALVIGVGSCFKLVYDSQTQMEHAVKRSNEIQSEQKLLIRQNIDVLKMHGEQFARTGTWQRIIEIRLTMIENELGIEPIPGD